MKKLVFLTFLMIIGISCSKKTQYTETEAPEKIWYDTTAIDSFSSGAISVDVARQIRMSSMAYQDSVRKVREQQEIEKALKEKEAKEEAEKKKAEEEKQKKEAEAKKQKETSDQANP